MVRIRLRRIGAKKKPVYRIVVARQQNARNGRFIENVGTYNPHTQPDTVTLETERVAQWLAVGAQPTDSVARLLRNAGLLDANNKPVPLDQIQENSAETSTQTNPQTNPGAADEAVAQATTDQAETEAAGETSDEAPVAA